MIPTTRDTLRHQLAAAALSSGAMTETFERSRGMGKSLAASAADAAEVADALAEAMLTRLGFGPKAITPEQGLLAEVWTFLGDPEIRCVLGRLRSVDPQHLEGLVRRIEQELATSR